MNKKFLGAILIAGLLLSSCGAEKNSATAELDAIKNFPEVAAHKDEPLNYLSMILTRRNHE